MRSSLTSHVKWFGLFFLVALLVIEIARAF